MVIKEARVWRIWEFLQRHGVTLLAVILLYFLFWIPATFVRVEVLSDPSGLSYRQTFFGIWNQSTDISSIGVCRFNEIVWSNEPQKWLFYGWVYAARFISGYVIIGPLLLYLERYRMPTPIFALIVISVIAFSFIAAITWFNEPSSSHTTWCVDRPRLQIQYFIPTIVHVALPLWWILYIHKRLKADPKDSPNVGKGK